MREGAAALPYGVKDVGAGRRAKGLGYPARQSIG